MRDVVIVAAARTPIGSFLSSLQTVPATELGAVAIRGVLAQSQVKAEDIEEVFMGCVLPAGLGQAPARQASLAAGLDKGVTCTTVNKVCGSGLKTVVLAAQAIASGDIDIAIAGGMENMSQAPHLQIGGRQGTKMGNITLIDSMVNDGLWDVYNDQHMGNCAELCAKEKGISREDQDAFAIESYKRAVAAIGDGLFKAEIVPVTIKTRKGEIVVDTDEEPGRGKPEKLPALRTALKKDGTITAGNASSLNDGGAALLLMSAEEAEKRGLTPMAKIVSYGQHAQAPEWFTTAPAAAITKACDKAGWKPEEVDLWEINEAFSVVSLVNNQILSLDSNKVNVDGGAVALGHPIGASGARILVTLLHAMKRRDVKRGGASLCIGGGEGIALMVERS
ncbi:MAG: acetyl-CoA C-acetyltransferase [Kofleriaceae bacterium]|nr:acetyl-CoA C-acetyltransferase [Kofleriaceae bacterium]